MRGADVVCVLGLLVGNRVMGRWLSRKETRREEISRIYAWVLVCWISKIGGGLGNIKCFYLKEPREVHVWKVFDLRCKSLGSSGLLLVEEMSNTDF